MSHLRRLDNMFARLKEAKEMAVMPYLQCGYPDIDTTLELMKALEIAGADALELGVAFSDPVADGVTIQQASHKALQNGVTLDQCINVVQIARRKLGVRMPILLMSYYNVFLAKGLAETAHQLKEADADGLIVPDLPPEESRELRTALSKADLCLIPFMAPTTTDERMCKIATSAEGFIYCVSVTGVTGARDELSQELSPFLKRAREHTSVPLVVGFGISNAAHVTQLRGLADGVITASALIQLMDSACAETRIESVGRFVAELKQASRAFQTS